MQGEYGRGMETTSFPRVVVPIDGSVLGESAAYAAADLARRAGISVTLFGITFDDHERKRVVGDAEDLARSFGEGVSTEIVVDAMGAVTRVEGYVATSIVEEAQRDGALVCMASHGRSGFGAALLGSTTEQVLRTSNAPVLVVGPHFVHPRPELTDGRVVVCVDGSDLSEHSLAPAQAWAERFGMTPWLVQVIDPIGSVASDVAPRSDVSETNYLRRLARRVPGAQYDVLHSDDVAHELTRLAQEWPVDLMVIASHARRGMSRVVLGSVAMKVVHSATCPVLIVPPEHAGTETEAESAGTGT